MLLLDLPEEILSLILSQLPLTDLVPLSVSCRTIRNLSSTSLSPFTSVVDSAIEEAFVPRASEEDPEATSSTSTRHLLATLGTYSHIHSRALLPLLIRAPLRPILDECQLPRLLAREWKEAFEARFLPSWKRIKQEGESWRACFLRTARLLLHRQSGCSHEEMWTRFLMLNRNGSASLNRLYSRGFDPIASFEEIKTQHALSSHQTHARLVLRLQDVRIIAIGVRAPPSSVWVNRNAFALLHPPGLREWEASRVRSANLDQVGKSTGANASPADDVVGHDAGYSGRPSTAARFIIKEEDGAGPLQIRRDRSDATRGSSTTSPLTQARSPSFDATTGLRRTLRTRSRGVDGDNARATTNGPKNRTGGLNIKRWSMGSRSGSSTLDNSNQVPEGTSLQAGHAVATFGCSAEDAIDIAKEAAPQDSIPAGTVSALKTLPFRPLRRPLPAASHHLYPNYTRTGDQPGPGEHDLRGRYETDVAPGAFYYGPRSGASTAERDRQDKMVDVEVDQDGSVHTWVGPMLLLAQLQLSHASVNDIDGPVSPAYPSLGAPGSFVNLEWEDLDVIAPWISLRGDDGGEQQAGLTGGPGGYGIVEARRDGLGFGH